MTTLGDCCPLLGATAGLTTRASNTPVAGLNDAVQVGIDEVQAGGRTPMSQEARLDVLGTQRLAQQRIIEQVVFSKSRLAR